MAFNPAHSLFVKTCRGERGSRPPIWLMRQAGRYMPEYRAIRAQHSMLTVIQTPELACEVTLQPVEAFRPDAAIIFADILTLLIGMGLNLDFVAGEGPRIFNPLSSAADIAKLKTPPAGENVGYTLTAVQMTARALAATETPLIGFSGAPFTLAAYAIEDQISDGLQKLKALMLQDTKSWDLLQEKLSTVVADYLIEQARAGAAALQLFDSWVGTLSPLHFERHVLPWIQRVVQLVRAKTDVPIIYFGTNTAGLFPHYQSIGADVYGADWRITLNDAAARIGGNPVLQGNLDPNILFAEWPVIKDSVEAILAAGQQLRGHIFNLGHGILPGTPVENVRRLFSYVQNLSAAER